MTLSKLRELKERRDAACRRYLDQMESSGWANDHIERAWVEATAAYNDASAEYVDQLLEEKPIQPHGTEVIVK